MAEAPKRRRTTSSVWSPEISEGTHDFIVHKYSLCKGIGVGKFIFSDEFHVGGCSWRIDFYPDGANRDFSDYIGIYLRLVSGKFDGVTFEIMLLDQGPEKKHRVMAEKQAISFELSRGWHYFMKRDELEASTFLKDDCIRIRCVNCVVMKENALTPITTSIALPPSNMAVHFRHILESGKGSDVNFDVGGESFAAHKIILAARSSVFNAQFFGLLKDEANPIKIHEMEAVVFKALLHFIYCDDLPDLNGFAQFDSVWTPTVMYQRLLAAADRYDLDRLKLLCASHISESIEMDNVVSIWALAVQHHCASLKTCCVEFAASIKNIQGLIQTDDFKQIKENDPSIVADFLVSVSPCKMEGQ